MAILVHTTADGKEYVLGDRTVIGRMDTADIRILDGLISKQHAEITFANGRWSLRDLGSSNGTMVNGYRVHAHDLNEGDQISVGAARLTFTHRTPQKSAPAVEMVETSTPMV